VTALLVIGIIVLSLVFACLVMMHMIMSDLITGMRTIFEESAKSLGQGDGSGAGR
jgi:hypothetical protein